MAIVNATEGVELIGQTAGDVWHLLHDQGSLPITKLLKEINAPRDLVLQALGWLARRQDRGRRSLAPQNDFAARVNASFGD